jgi:hypothetical protein
MLQRCILNAMTIDHPTWCDPACCEAEDWVRHHRGTPVTLPPAESGDVEIRLQLTALAWEPVEAGTARIEAVLSRPDLGSVETYYFDHRSAGRLHEALGALLPVVASAA